MSDKWLNMPDGLRLPTNLISELRARIAELEKQLAESVPKSEVEPLRRYIVDLERLLKDKS